MSCRGNRQPHEQSKEKSGGRCHSPTAQFASRTNSKQKDSVMKSSTPKATYLSDKTVELEFPFLARLVDDLKLHIPAPYRGWDPDRKVWTVSGPTADWADFGVDLLKRAFPEARVIRRSASSASISLATDAY